MVRNIQKAPKLFAVKSKSSPVHLISLPSSKPNSYQFLVHLYRKIFYHVLASITFIFNMKSYIYISSIT